MILNDNSPISVNFSCVLPDERDARVQNFCETTILKTENSDPRIIRGDVCEDIIYLCEYGDRFFAERPPRRAISRQRRSRALPFQSRGHEPAGAAGVAG